LPRAVLPQVQDLMPVFVKIYLVPSGAFLQLVKAPMNGGPALPILAAPCNVMLSMSFRDQIA